MKNVHSIIANDFSYFTFCLLNLSIGFWIRLHNLHNLARLQDLFIRRGGIPFPRGKRCQDLIFYRVPLQRKREVKVPGKGRGVSSSRAINVTIAGKKFKVLAALVMANTRSFFD